MLRMLKNWLKFWLVSPERLDEVRSSGISSISWSCSGSKFLDSIRKQGIGTAGQCSISEDNSSSRVWWQSTQSWAGRVDTKSPASTAGPDFRLGLIFEEISHSRAVKMRLCVAETVFTVRVWPGSLVFCDSWRSHRPCHQKASKSLGWQKIIWN